MSVLCRLGMHRHQRTSEPWQFEGRVWFVDRCRGCGRRRILVP